jgi:hypothetical protein
MSQNIYWNHESCASIYQVWEHVGSDICDYIIRKVTVHAFSVYLPDI